MQRMHYTQVLRSRFKAALSNRTNNANIFDIEFVVKYGHTKHEIGVCYPQHGAVTPLSAVGELPAVPITVSEPFLQLTAKNGTQSFQ